ncbi:MAG: ABC transporter substrate-binding protein [Acidimicrobiia bacterium]|nr:ABC transporter substrate-binding protein [Acidimicrobiia bacterium]
MRRHRAGVVGAAAVVMALVAGACGGGGGGSSTAKKGTVTMASFNFPEGVVLADVYGKALQGAGYTVVYKLNLGTRQVIQPALLNGQIDSIPMYAASDLEFANNNAGQATSDTQATVQKLRDLYAPKGVTILDAAPAIDTNAFAVTKATADKYHLKAISDLKAVAKQLVIAVPPECPTNKYCGVGLQNVYGLPLSAFKSTTPLAIGPVADAALARGDVQVAEVLSTDGAVQANGFVVLDDDKHLQSADNVVPALRTAKLNNEIRDLWNSVSAKLTTTALIGMNKRLDIDKQDPNVVAQDWLRANGFKV